MPKSIILYILLFALSSAEELVFKQPTWTKRIEFSQHRSVSVIAIGLHLFTVSHNTTHVYINSTDKNYKNCIFAVNSFDQNHIEAAVLGNRGKIVVWSVYQLHFHAETVKVFATMLLVDPWHCVYKKLPLTEDQQSRYLHRMNFDLTGWQPALRVLTYFDTFDVFFGGSNVCSPCRFNDEGEKIEMLHQLKPADNDTFGAAFIEALDFNSHFRGYLQIFQLINHTALLKILNSNFTALKQIHIEHHISKVFVSRGKNAIIGICYLAPPSQQSRRKLGDIYCKRFNSKLQLEGSINVSLATNYYPIGFSLTLDPFGNMFVTCETSHNNSTELALFRYNKTGQLVESFDLGQLQAIGGELLVHRPLFVNREFCFVTAERFHINSVLKCMKMQITEK